MLEIRNVTKIYHSKNGNSVKALDNISMTFPETGMVFILGKSGSGKSTLLNVIGGLDGYDSGEFVIKGKSSKDFAGSDFDAYRNTFIGFIFQEYNILDDFTVGANIGLALELQGKKATNEKITGILSQVEMLEYAKRKPNELSGGQKQRIAIARALVKDPEIIMADEPTGALDSNTGKQIFDTLKELSKTKLVIIVSHDRDFAEQYGDRIIEMKDGNILSDVTKHKVAAKPMSGGILQMNDNLLRIEKGYQLTAKDLELINAYLREQPAEILISGDSRINTGVRNTAGISEDNTSAVFKDTNEKKDFKVKEYDKKNTKFIRSRLPFKNAFKIGSSSLGHKKFRLVVTIFLSLIAFALFGFADTLGAYNKIVAATDSIIDSNVKNASFSLGVKHTWTHSDGDSNSSYYTEAMNDKDIKSLTDRTGIKFIPVFNGTAGESWGGSRINISNMMVSTDKISAGTAYTGEMYGFTVLSDKDVSSLNFNLVGKMPASKDEIVITKFMCDELNLTGFTNVNFDEKIDAGNLVIDAEGGKNSIIGKHFSVQMNGMLYNFVISGVMDTVFDTERYADYIPSDKNQQNMSEDIDIMGMMMEKELKNTLEYGFHGLGYIHSDMLSDMAENMRLAFGNFSSIGTYINGWNLNLKMPYEQSGASDMIKGDIYVNGGMISGSEDRYLMYVSKVGTSADIKSLDGVEWFDGRTTNKLGEKEILVPSTILRDMASESNVTEQIKAIISEMYGSEAAERADGSIGISSLMREIEIEKHMNALAITDANRAEVFAKYLEFYGVSPDDPTYGGLDTSDEVLLNFIKERYSNYDTYWVPESMLINEAELESAACVEFLNRFLGENDLKAEYGSEFFTNVVNSLVSSRGDGYYLSSGNFVELYARSYAYKMIFEDKIDFASEEFFNSVMKDKNGETDFEKYKENVNKYSAAYWYADYIMYNTYDDMTDIFGEKRRSDFEDSADAKFKEITRFDPKSVLSTAYLERTSWDKGGESIEKLKGYKIVGTFDAGNNTDVIICDTLYSAYQAYVKESGMSIETIAPHEPGIYAFAIAPMPTDRNVIQNLVEISYDESGDYQFSLQNQVMNTLGSFNNFIEMGAKIFLYIGIGFAVFSALMLMNFISVSISYKRREIGILRAVGARSSDVFKIFFSEAFLIALINCVLSIAATITATIIFNDLVRKEGINVTLLHFGVRQVILMVIISVFVAAIASFFPVWNIARRKPIDAIKNK